MQGITVDGRWPKSKKEVKEVVRSEPRRVRVFATSVFGDEWQGRLDQLPAGKEVHFCGPDVNHDRRFYGFVVRRGDELVVR